MKSQNKSQNLFNQNIKCRTCFGPLDATSSTDIREEKVLAKTVKDVLLVFISQMVTSSVVGNLICCKCTSQVRNFAHFLENFINAEKRIIEENIRQERQKIKVEVNSNNLVKSAPVNLMYIIPTTNQNGIQNAITPLQPIQLPTLPINYLLTPSINSNMSLLKSVSQIVQSGTKDTIHNKKNLLPKIQEQQKENTLKKLVEHIIELDDSEDDSVGNTSEEMKICLTCDDIFTTRDLTTKKCSKCSAKLNKTSRKTNEADLLSESNTNGHNIDLKTKVNPVILRKEQTGTNVELLENLKGQAHDTIISIVNDSEQIDLFANDFLQDKVKVIDFGPSSNMEKKRLLFIGNSTSQCEECKTLLKDPRKLKLHFAEAHSDISISEENSEEEEMEGVAGGNEKKRTFDCPFCEIQMTAAMQLVEHLHKEHTIENPFKCEKCGKEFKKRDAYLEHLKKFEAVPHCSMKRCPVCSEWFEKSEFQSHLMTHENIVCDKCGRSFSSVRYFNIHYVTHLENRVKSESKKNTAEAHLCPICGKLLRNGNNLKVHLQTHNQNRARNYICHMCPKTFLTTHALNKHLDTAHVEKKHECPICHIKVKTASALTNHHNLKHSQINSHFCDICGQGFSRGDYYRRHLASHANRDRPSEGRGHNRGKKKYNYSVRIESKPVKCKYCLKLFKNVYLLRTHALQHVKSIRYRCKFCDMTFANMGTRYRHQKRHADPKFDLSCTICWKRMDSKEKLVVHLAKHEGTKKYNCPECGELISSKYLLKHHMVEKHTTEELIEHEKKLVLSTTLSEFLL